jgi:hypothetical protein
MLYFAGSRTGLAASMGEAFEVGPGHDDWIVGDEPCVGLDFEYLNLALVNGAYGTPFRNRVSLAARLKPRFHFHANPISINRV